MSNAFGRPISRRVFAAALLGALAGSAIWWWSRRRGGGLDVGSEIQAFFGLDRDVSSLLTAELEALERRERSAYYATWIFFALSRWHLHGLLPRARREQVVGYWSGVLFSHRSLAWPYVGYPQVSDFPLCNGLVRQVER